MLCTVMEKNGIKKPKITFSERRLGDVMRNYSDTSKAKAQLGWIPKVDLETGLAKTLEDLLK